MIFAQRSSSKSSSQLITISMGFVWNRTNELTWLDSISKFSSILVINLFSCVLFCHLALVKFGVVVLRVDDQFVALLEFRQNNFLVIYNHGRLCMYVCQLPNWFIFPSSLHLLLIFKILHKKVSSSYPIRFLISQQAYLTVGFALRFLIVTYFSSRLLIFATL